MKKWWDALCIFKLPDFQFPLSISTFKFLYFHFQVSRFPFFHFPFPLSNFYISIFKFPGFHFSTFHFHFQIFVCPFSSFQVSIFPLSMSTFKFFISMFKFPGFYISSFHFPFPLSNFNSNNVWTLNASLHSYFRFEIMYVFRDIRSNQQHVCRTENISVNNMETSKNIQYIQTTCKNMLWKTKKHQHQNTTTPSQKHHTTKGYTTTPPQ